MNAADWEAEFAKYKTSPEFKLLHSTMTVDEFKFIYWMEWAHRMWGRALGIAFVVPGEPLLPALGRVIQGYEIKNHLL